jgi:hypothetical protein
MLCPYSNQQKQKTMKTLFLKQAITAIAVCITIAGSAQNREPRQPREPRQAGTERFGYNNQYLNIDEDSSTNPPTITVAYKDAWKRYNFVMSGDKLTEMYVNGHQVPTDSFYLYNDLVTKVKKQIIADRAQALADMKQAERDREQAERDRQQAVKDQEQAGRDREQAERDRQQAEEDRKQAIKDQAQAGEDSKQADRDREQAVKDRQQAEEDRKQAELDRQQAVKDREQGEEDRKQAEIDRKQAEEDRKMIKALVTDIIADGLAPNENGIRHIDLNDDELIVNGKLQSAELLKKYKAKYIKKPGYSLHYNNTPNNHGLSINS